MVKGRRRRRLYLSLTLVAALAGCTKTASTDARSHTSPRSREIVITTAGASDHRNSIREADRAVKQLVEA